MTDPGDYAGPKTHDPGEYSTAGDLADDCSSCGEECAPPNECPRSRRPCGHHCNHSWSHDACCWCGKEFGEETP